MDIQTLTSFFMWCTIINASIFTLWTVMFVFAPDLVYRKHTFFFPMPRDTFNIVIYSFFGLYKIFFILFNIVPYIALRIIGSEG